MKLVAVVLLSLVMSTSCAGMSVLGTMASVKAFSQSTIDTVNAGCASGVISAERCAKIQPILAVAWFAEQGLMSAVDAFEKSPTMENKVALESATINAEKTRSVALKVTIP
jgi:hypothetical protein